MLVLIVSLSMLWARGAVFGFLRESGARRDTSSSARVALVAMWIVAQVPPQDADALRGCRHTVIGVVLLIAVALAGDVVNGARRWLHVGRDTLPAFRDDEARAAD